MSDRDRRRFIAAGIPGLLSVCAALAEAEPQQVPEAGAYRFDMPPKSTLWGVVVFLSETVVEVTISGGKQQSQLVRGRFDGSRLNEFTFENETDERLPVNVSAKANGAAGTLPMGAARFVAEQHLFLGFGQRAAPVETARRHGGYPHDAMLIGFFVYDA